MTETDPPPRPERPAGAAKPAESGPRPIWMLLLGFLSAMALAGCCVCAGALWWFRPRIHEDPAMAREMTPEIVSIAIPEVLQPRGTIIWRIGFLLTIRGVYYERFTGDGLMTLVEVNSRFRTDQDVQRHIRTTLMEKGGGGTPLVIDHSRTEEKVFVIRGQEIRFRFNVGKDPTSGRIYHLAEGVFPGDGGEVLLALRIEESHWNEQEVLDMLNSIGQ